MLAPSTIQAHIGYELLDQRQPNVVMIDFVSRTISDPIHAHELGEQLDWLIRPELPLNYVIDMKNVKALGSTAFGELCAFARRVQWWGGRVRVCELHPSLHLGAALIGLEQYAEFSPTRQSAIQEARKAAEQSEEKTVDYPVFWS
jgi:anti-anti-sigma regulatory factor